MYTTIPVYYPSIETANRQDENGMWLDSHNFDQEGKTPDIMGDYYAEYEEDEEPEKDEAGREAEPC